MHKNNDLVAKGTPLTILGNTRTFTITDYSLPEILFITSYPPRECGIATYSEDLRKALDSKFTESFVIRICALESENEQHDYGDNIKYILNTDESDSFENLSKNINTNEDISIVLVQHEFGFFEGKEEKFQNFLDSLSKPIVVVFHTVLPHPDKAFKIRVQKISSAVTSIIVMTNSASQILMTDYGIDKGKITVIPHGTHLVPHSDKKVLKKKYRLEGKKVLSTFGLLSSGKSIETTLEALPGITKENPDVLFLIIGKTHPTVVKQDGESYRQMLEARVAELKMLPYVRFINQFLSLPELLEYLQLTDIYLFTSKDPNQAVSGTFSYATSSGCPIISTPIPHALEVLKNDAGIIIDFQNSVLLESAVKSLLADEQLRKNISLNGIHRMASTAWENSAIAYAMLFEKISNEKITLEFTLPAINLDHVKRLTTEFGMIQFAKINQPDISSGYTLDDNARALITMCQHYELTMDQRDMKYISLYFNFLKYCQQPDGGFLNYVNQDSSFSEQNNDTNLEDANGRAIWSLGYLISIRHLLPRELSLDAEEVIQRTLPNMFNIHSTRAMAFVLKGLYYRNIKNKSAENLSLISMFADRLVQMYRHESEDDWHWFESYLTYANSLLPEAMLCAWSATGDAGYKEIAQSSFTFLLSKTFRKDKIKVISNRSWLHKNEVSFPITIWGEQPIDVAYTIFALGKFYEVFKDESYLEKMRASFDWFLGNNHLHQIIYNPCTGGCYDGLEENHVNLNQGAESTLSYQMARLTVEKYFGTDKAIKHETIPYIEVSVPGKLVNV